MSDQLDLRVVRPVKPVTNQELESIVSWPAALSAAVSVSGLQDKSLAIETGIDNAQFSRMCSGQAGWTADKLFRFMDAAGTELPLMWLNYQRGYDIEAMRQRETEYQKRIRELEERLAASEMKNEIIAELVRGKAA